MRAALVSATRLMTVLGRPNREQVVTTRPAELTTLDALELSNGAELAAIVNAGAGELQRRFAEQPRGESIGWLYTAALGRAPAADETQIALTYLNAATEQDGWGDLLWALVVTPEFCFVR